MFSVWSASGGWGVGGHCCNFPPSLLSKFSDKNTDTHILLLTHTITHTQTPQQTVDLCSHVFSYICVFLQVVVFGGEGLVMCSVLLFLSLFHIFSACFIFPLLLFFEAASKYLDQRASRYVIK